MGFSDKCVSVFKRDIFTKLWSILAGVIIARILGPASMGIWYILLMIPSYAEPFGRFKCDIASVYYLGKGKYSFAETYFNLIAVTLISSAAVMLFFLWQRQFIFETLLKSSLSDRYLVYAMILYIPVSFINICYSYLFLAKEDVVGYNLLVILPLVISTLLSVILLILKLGLTGLVLATLCGGIIGVCFAAHRIAKTERMFFHVNIPMLKDFFKFGSKLYLSGLVDHFQLYVSAMLVAVFLIPSAVTFYRMGQQNALLLCMITSAVGTFLYPLVTRENENNGNMITIRTCRLCMLILVILAVFGAVLVKPAVLILYGKTFLPQVEPFLIILPGVVLYGASTLLSSYFLGKGKPGIVLKLSFIPLLTQLVLCTILIPRFGIIGAAISTSISYALAGIFNIIIFSALVGVTIQDAVVPRKADLVLLIQTAVSLLK